MNKNDAKKERGITLITLLITIIIIIMIILVILIAIVMNKSKQENPLGLVEEVAEQESNKTETNDTVEQGLNETEEDLYRYILGGEKTGRNMDEISNFTDFLYEWDISVLEFKKDATMETDLSTSIKALDVGYPEVWKEENYIDYVYIKYENKVYRITVEENNNNQTTALKKVYEPTGLEGQTVEYSYDGSEQNKKDWTIIKDNKNGTVDIVSPDILGNLTLGQSGYTNSEAENEQISQTIGDYNEAIEKINQECQKLVTNTNKVKVKSVGAATDNTTIAYTSDRITEWTSQYPYYSLYNGKEKTGDMYYEDDLVRMNYHNVVNTGTQYWLASRDIDDHSSSVNFGVDSVDEEGMPYYYSLWGVSSDGLVYSRACSRGVRPVVTIEYPISE